MAQTNESEDIPLVADFFDGKSVFLTGASGFLGTVLLEALLRCFPGIASVYVLLRPKRGLMPNQRKEMIFQKKIFSVLKEKRPEMLRKVHFVTGDVSQPKLGLNEKDIKCITEEVSIVFHCAASINLSKPLRYMVQQNSYSTKSLINLCQKMKKFCALVYTSSSYSNYSQLGLPIKEEVYRLPIHPSTFFNALNEKNDEIFLEMASQCKSNWPTMYSISKCLSENILEDVASILPVAIIRTSIIASTWKNPMPGYLDENSTYAIASVSVGEGFIKVLYGDPNIKVNIIPADVVANAHIMAAWSISTKKVPSPLVVNCTSRDFLNLSWNETFKTVKRVFQGYKPIKYSGRHKKVTIIKNRTLYWLATVNEHYLPGIIADIILLIKGEKPRVSATYHVFHKFWNQIGINQLLSPQCVSRNLNYLNGLLHEKDRKLLDVGFENTTLEDYMRPALEKVPPYNWKSHNEILMQYDWLISVIRHVILICCGCFVYLLTIALL